MTKTTYRCCERDRSAASQVIPSHSTKSHDFFNVNGGIYSVNVFPSKFMHIFSYRIKSLSYSIVRISFFMRIFRIDVHLGVSIQRFFNAIFQNAHKNRWMETHLMCVLLCFVLLFKSLGSVSLFCSPRLHLFD